MTDESNTQAVELAVAKAILELEIEKASLIAEVRSMELERQRMEVRYREKLITELGKKDEMVRQKEEEIDRYKNLRISSIHKTDIGKELEEFCENEFLKVRPFLSHATFEKDTVVIGGSKGDYIYREYDREGSEVLTIMVECKNQYFFDVVVAKNRQYLSKLDKDRNNKGCEYAVLVSTLEPDSSLYNRGIVDMSHLFPKMLVVRPQFFTVAIALLRFAAVESLERKKS